MKLGLILLVASALQICVVSGQANTRYARRKGSSRRTTQSDTPTSLLPAFITRAFGGSGTKPEAEKQQTSPQKLWTPSARRVAKRPFISGNLAGFPGTGPFAAGAIQRRRFVRKNNSRHVLANLPVANIPKVGPTVQAIQPAAVILSPAVLPHPLGHAAGVALATPPQSLEGWVSFPTESPIATTTKYTPTIGNKPGVCGNPLSYGIKCRERMDQCSNDSHCPGSTRCCMVGECGYLCVKPKATSDIPKKKWGGASSVLKRQREADLLIESSTTATGLKLDDITLKNSKL